MFRIFGNIRVKETGEAIPGLVVVVFDVDPTQFDPNHLVVRDLPEGVRADRLGSVLTDAGGHFELTFEQADFQLSDQEERPDLMLVVFAPEDSRSANEPSPVTPQERVLHVSRVPRQDAGRTEAYAIRLLKAQLDRFEIPAGGDRATLDPAQYVAAVQGAWDFQDAVKKGLQP
ncbi:hypothetical protein FGL86_08455 [Pistricoccus aurantiacus]|uniref:Uncharacterized protein n=1 Tax=Pistricoccus aurantiacus TaxID=1883414 RepID=A0A5B8SPS9_9GAMM|nr:hypothetical protein [Pistricoccus aurantiacus]QEA39099.1 hypothetical protein FGL86_08455 [Pistricoccus aurantiacus]